MTDMAFHENWYEFGPSIKRTFMLMILSNNLECKLTRCEKLNLSLPSFMTVRLHKHYQYRVCVNLFVTILKCHKSISSNVY